MTDQLDLTAPRPPSAWRRLIRTRTRRLTGRYARKDPAEYRRTLDEIVAIARAAADQHQR